jgi:hypothetical protein
MVNAKKLLKKFRLPIDQAPFRVGRVLSHHLISIYMVPYFPDTLKGSWARERERERERGEGERER